MYASAMDGTIYLSADGGLNGQSNSRNYDLNDARNDEREEIRSFIKKISVWRKILGLLRESCPAASREPDNA